MYMKQYFVIMMKMFVIQQQVIIKYNIFKKKPATLYRIKYCQHNLINYIICPSLPSLLAIEVLISVSHLFLAINSAFNFIIYMFRGDRFRHVFWKIFILRQWTRERRRSLQPAGSIPMARYVHTNLNIANKSVRPFLFTISNFSLYQM